MKGWVLDTSAYSWGLRGHPEISDLMRTADRLVLPAIVLGELRAGFRLGTQDRKNRRLLQAFLDSVRVSVLPVTDETAERYAEILAGLKVQGTPVPTNDVWIAAGAMEAGLPVLTTDAHYERIPQILLRLIAV